MCLVESVGSPPSTCWPPFCFHTSRSNNFHLPLPRVSLSNQSISRDPFGRGVRDSSLFFSESRRGRYKEEEENGKELERRRRFDRIPLPSKKPIHHYWEEEREKKNDTTQNHVSWRGKCVKNGCLIQINHSVRFPSSAQRGMPSC